MSARSWLEPRIFLAPENDQGADFDDPIEEGFDPDQEGPEEGDDEEFDPDRGGEEPTGEDEGEEDGRSEAPLSRPVREPSRASRRVQEAIRRAKSAEDELARIRGEQSSSQTREQQARAAAEERERLANMDPEQRLEYRIQKQAEQHRADMAQMQFTMQDSADRTAFDGYCARTPVAQKLRDEVEDRLAELRRGGTTAPRETVLRWVIGDRALTNAGRAKGKATKRADANRANQTTRPGSGRGDAAGEGRRSGADSREARERRLDGVKL